MDVGTEYERLKGLHETDAWWRKEVATETELLETGNLEVTLHVVAGDVLAHAVGSVVFEAEEIARHNREAYRQYKQAIALEPENPHLWWKLAFLLQFCEKTHGNEVKYVLAYKQALVNTIRFSENPQYKHTIHIVKAGKATLKASFGEDWSVSK